ncbi:MAG TPA: outer membrane protein assembly factor BamA, partial [Gammaproteobacteria bacterium]|nr:outer membrane protein assembly factor BamA [Gammaproteobacteria bacterium]
RELRQLEGGWISTEQVKRSRVRLQRLGYFEEVNVETPAVPGTDDQVDVNFNVKERSTFGSFVFGVGFSQSQGLLLNSSVSEDNFLGTGKRVSATINNSRVNTIYSFSYTNPYYTQDGVSRGFRLFWRTTDAGRANVADFTSDAYGGNVNYGIPLSEYDTLRASVGLEHTKLKTLSTTPQAYVNYINDNKDEFDVYQLGLSWSHDTRNRAFFPDAGILQRLSLDAAVPGSGVTYYKLASRTSWYQALNKYFTLVAEGDVAYGEAYGDTSGFPFFENYYAGGISSVRGYRANSLGPKENGRALGGAFRTLASAEVFFPPPFAADTNSFRFGIFFDIGNVFASVDDFDGSELRYSTGVSALWLSPLGPLTFSFGKALNKQAQDDTEIFQFSLGAAF